MIGVLREAEVAPLAEIFPTRRMWRVKDATGRRNGLELAAALSGRPGVTFAEADLVVPRTRESIPVPPNDPSYPAQWYLPIVKIEGAWRHTTGSPNVTIQVIDNGCDMTHPDLAPHVLQGRDVVDGDDDPQVTESGNGSGHGTACAGIVAAVGHNGLGIAGTCPECKVRCVRMLDKTVNVPISADVEAMRFALLHPDVAVVSNSWGFTTAIPVPTSLRMAIEDVSRMGHGGRGALVVFAAGNENRELLSTELHSIPEVLTVGATNNFDESAPFTNRGEAVDISAPTGSVTLDPVGDAGENATDYVSNFGGTSAACPVVAGVAALLFAAKPDATSAEVFDALVKTARQSPYATPDVRGHDLEYGYGIVDARAALERLLGIDAGTDAGSPDAGLPDAGPHDAGPMMTADAGPAPTDPPKGCGCNGAHAPLAFAAWALAVAVARRLRTVTR
ncbi:MAG: S8 family serine peptidase [Myxococcaceae bacterium]|nr:S8 family serine peptidase [Myxococcaceae bacterium]